MHLYWEYLILKSFFICFFTNGFTFVSKFERLMEIAKRAVNTARILTILAFHGGFDLDLCLFAQCDGGLYL